MTYPTIDEEAAMDIQISTDATIDKGEAALDRLEASVSEGLSRFQDQLTRVEVHLSDENAGKDGPSDKRCVLEARPAGMQPLAVSHDADTVDGACTGAMRKLQQLLDHRFGRLDAKGGRDTIRQERS